MAAKVIRVSPDSGVTWHNLPGSTGSFTLDGETIDDTIFGQNFASGQTGLINWSVDANALYKGFAGYLTKIYETGTPTPVVGETMTLVSGQTYRIDDSSKEVWDRTASIVVYDDVADVTAEVEKFDYLFGQVIFKDTYTVIGAITIDVTYLPLQQTCKANSYTLTQTAATIDESEYCNTQANDGNRVFDYGLKTVTLELGGIYNADTGAKAQLTSRAEFIMEVDPVGDGLSKARGFFKASTVGQSGDVGALEEETRTFTLSVPADDKLYLPFEWWWDPSTLLPVGIQDLLTAWETEALLTAQYLPSGAPGQSPLDGVEGLVVAADVSMSGGLSDMNTFTATLQGSDAITEV